MQQKQMGEDDSKLMDEMEADDLMWRHATMNGGMWCSGPMKEIS